MIAKPRAGAKPNMAHPHAIGLSHCLLFNERAGKVVRDCVGGAIGTVTSGVPIWAAKMHGGSMTFTGTQKITFTGKLLGKAGGPFTIVAGVMNNGQSGYGTIWANGGSGLYLNNANLEYFGTTSIAGMTVGVPLVVCYANSDPSSVGVLRAYLGIGGRVASGAAGFLLDAASTIGLDSALNADISFIYIYNRYLTPAQYQQVAADPFAMFARLPTRAWSSASAQAFRPLLVSP